MSDFLSEDQVRDVVQDEEQKARKWLGDVLQTDIFLEERTDISFLDILSNGKILISLFNKLFPTRAVKESSSPSPLFRAKVFKKSQKNTILSEFFYYL